MAHDIPFILCRYNFIRKNAALTETEQLSLLNQLKGRPVAYRNREPGPEDFDTFEMAPRHYTFDNLGAFSWSVGYDIKQREEADYDRLRDEIAERLVAADGIKFTRFIGVPSLQALAVSDQHGDIHLGGVAGISRFKSVVRSVKGTRIRIEMAGSTADISRAFQKWQVEQFSFAVRPFNPTRRRLGGKLHDLMMKNRIAQLNGVAKPDGDGKIARPGTGIVGEAIGLADQGYGQVAVKGITGSGRQAMIGKPHFSQEKGKNKSRQAKPRLLKIYVDQNAASERRRVEEVVRALVEYYGK